LKTYLNKTLFTQVDNSPLIVFRIFFGLFVFLETAGSIATGWVKEALVDPQYHLPFIGFEWLTLPNDYLYYVYYIVMALTGILIMLGLFYKASIAVFTFMWWGSYLMQKTHYNNHYYLFLLLAFFMILVPAHRYFSLDVKRKPQLKSLTCPKWCLLIFIIQIGIVYTFAAIAKVNPDWMNGTFISLMFQGKAHFPIIGTLLQEVWLIKSVVVGGILFDFFITPLLLWKRTRVLAFILSVFFNLFNSIVFHIGVFPYMMIALTIFFFPSDKIRRIFFKSKPLINEIHSIEERKEWYSGLLIPALSVYFLFQIAIPLRHYFYKGNVAWTEQGHRMSWRMMLKLKYSNISFRVKNTDTGESSYVKLSDYFTPNQIRDIGSKPDMLWQGVQILKKVFAEKGWNKIEIYAKSSVSLNGHSYKPLVSRDTDLAKVEWGSFTHSDWLLLYD
jgi:hypothetical protein